MNDWRTALLKGIDAPATPQNLQFLANWQRWEGGHTNNSAQYNWLNTTHGPGPSINSVGVKRFPSFQVGIRSTAETLLNGRYNDILDGLKSGDPRNVGAGLQVWVSGKPDGNPAYAAKVLGHPAPAPAARIAYGRQKVAGVKAAMRAIPQDTPWDVAMKMIFADDPEMRAFMVGADDKQAQATGLVSPGGRIRPLDFETGDLKSSVPVLRNLTKAAESQLGKPYVFGSGPDTNSFDCSDLVQWAYKQIGVRIPRVTYDQIKAGRSVKGQPLKPGDLIFPHTGHVVMYVGNGQVIAAPYTGTVVQYQPISRFKNPLEVRRIL